MTGNSQYVVYGGEFPRVNGNGQQGLVRFAVPQHRAQRAWARGDRRLHADRACRRRAPSASRWRAAWDRDNEHLTYRVLPGQRHDAPVVRGDRPTRWYDLPTTAVPRRGVRPDAPLPGAGDRPARQRRDERERRPRRSRPEPPARRLPQRGDR